jgi:hypothetical protein
MLLTFGIWIVVLNWACAIASYRLQQSRMQRGVCVVPAVAQVLVAAAALVSSLGSSPLLPGWFFWLVALTDVALLQILYLPVLLVRRESVRKSTFAAGKLRSTAAKT